MIGTEDKDVRKGNWNPKEVSYLGSCMAILSCTMRKSDMLDLTQLVEAGVTPQYAHEINYTLTLPLPLSVLPKLSR